MTEVIELREKIKQADQAYTTGAETGFTDAEYDQMVARLAALEGKAPEVMEDSLGDGECPHFAPMGSLRKVFSQEDLSAFTRACIKANRGLPVTFSTEHKLDGLACNLQYKDGKLDKVLTRGKRGMGGNITHNVACMEGVVMELPDFTGPHTGVTEIRGELVMRWVEFERVNKRLVAVGEEPYANPRNLAVGTVGQLELKDDRKLSFVAYGIGRRDAPNAVLNYSELRAWFMRMGFEVPELFRQASRLDDVFAAVQLFGDLRRTSPYLTDGTVIKVQDIGLRDRLGYGGSSPNWAVAFKYPPEQVKTKLNSITLQIGRTGALTPVAELTPVSLAGSVISRCTLHNSDDILRKDLRVGDTVLLEKAGEIIPQIVGPVLEERDPEAVPYDIEAAIKDMGLTAVRPLGQAVWRLTAPTVGVRTRRLMHLASKACLDIEELGPENAAALVGRGMVKHPTDIFLLSAEHIDEALGGSRIGAKIHANIQAAKSRDLSRLIAALGIPNVGVNTSKILASHFKSLRSLAAAKIEDFLRSTKGPKGGLVQESLVESVGPLTAKSIVAFWEDPENFGIEARLEMQGVVTVHREDGIVPREGVAGLTFVVTGVLEAVSREEAHSLVERAGGKTAGSVSKKTSVLVVGSDAGNTKLKKADSLAVRIIYEPEFLALVGYEPKPPK